VLVVDFSRAFTDPGFPLGCDLSAALRSTRELLDAARAHQRPVVFTTQIYDAEHAGSALWGRKSALLKQLEPGSPLAELDDRLGRLPDEPVVAKLGASALFETNVGDLLRAAECDMVLVCGATTSGCVRATAVDLLQAGLPAFVVEDCVGDRAEAPHAANLYDIHAKYGEVIDLDAALQVVTASRQTTGAR
jgi:nicotinamidase-related amidase